MQRLCNMKQNVEAKEINDHTYLNGFVVFGTLLAIKIQRESGAVGLGLLSLPWPAHSG